MQTERNLVWEIHDIFSKISFIFSVTVIFIFHVSTAGSTVLLNCNKLQNWVVRDWLIMIDYY